MPKYPSLLCKARRVALRSGAFAALAFVVVFMLSPLAAPVHAAGEAEGGWSADLLNRILKTETSKEESVTPASAEMVLRTYQLTNLRVGEAGKSQNVLTILGKMLPAGSSLNPDVSANSLHILTTVTAHKAVWDYLSAVDVAEVPTAPTTAAVPDEVKLALKKLAEASDRSDRLLVAVGSLKSDVTQEIAKIDAEQRRHTLKLVAIGMAFAVFLVAIATWSLRRKMPKSAAEPAADATTALVVASEHLTTALTPVHDRMRNDMLGLLNEVAIKLQAQHNEQQKLVREQQQQLEDARHALAEERRQFISEAGTMVVQAVERVDATTAKLARQQDKVAELVQELQNTVRELDETKDSLRTKQVELEQERAKIAALSLLLEEGGSLPPDAMTGTAFAPAHAADGTRESSTPPAAATFSCTNPAPSPVPDQTGTPTATAEVPRFRFLPPDHPET
jgi:hypothetical protein